MGYPQEQLSNAIKKVKQHKNYYRSFSCKKIKEIAHTLMKVLIEGDTWWHQEQAFMFDTAIQTIKFYIK